MKRGTITITWSESVENHAKMQIIGNRANSGYTLKEMQDCMKIFNEKKENCCHLIHLNEIAEHKELEEIEDAYILIVRNGVNIILEENEKKSQNLFDELSVLDVDKKAFMKGRVVNKKARHNLCFADFSQEPEYENKKGRVYDFKELPIMRFLREKLPEYIDNSVNLFAEENYYYDLKVKEVGIGFHGDTERRKVIAMRLGESMNLVYQWFYQSEPVGKRIEFMLNDGDLYIMSDKAVGYDWMRKKIYTLRHATHHLAKVKK
jgi:hypothetical protein